MGWQLVCAALALTLAMPPVSAEAKRQELTDSVMDGIHAKGLAFDIVIEPIVMLPNAPSKPLVPEALSAPIVPASPLAPGKPESPGTPSLPQAPASVGVPTAPTAPSAPDEPFSPTSPVIPAAAQEAVVPQVVATVVGGEVLENSGTVSPAVPLSPSLPSSPVAPAQPVSPAVPATPSTPTAPATPVTPSTPATPTSPRSPSATAVQVAVPESYSQVVNSVNISGSQNGFSGLVSVTAVDSVVPVLLNVYINIDSQSGNSTNINVLDLKILTSE